MPTTTETMPTLRTSVDLLDAVKGAEGDTSKLPKEIWMIPLGQWETMPYGMLSITRDHLDAMVANFSRGIRPTPMPIDVDHDAGEAVGWINALTVKENGLWASVEWNARGEELLTQRRYRLFSPEFSLDYCDPLTSVSYGPMFIAGTLTNRPLFKQLDAIVANETGGDEANSDSVILSHSGQPEMGVSPRKEATVDQQDEQKKADDLSEETSLPTEQPAEGETVTEPTPETPAEEPTPLDESATPEEAPATEETPETEPTDAPAEEQPAEEPAAEPQETVTATEPKQEAVTITASEHQRLLAAELKVRRMEVEQEVSSKYLFSENGGRFAPKCKDALTTLVLTFSDEQRALFDEVAESIPERKLFSEEGSGEAGATDEESILERRANELLKEDSSLKYSDAIRRAERELRQQQ